MTFYVLVLSCVIVVSLALATAVHQGQRRIQKRAGSAQRLRARVGRLTDLLDELTAIPVQSAVLDVLGEERRRCGLQLEAEHQITVDCEWQSVGEERGASFLRTDELSLRRAVAATRRAQTLLYELAEDRRVDPEVYKALVKELGRCEVRLQAESLEHMAGAEEDSDRLSALRKLRMAAELLLKNAHLDREFNHRVHGLRRRIATIQSGLAADGVRASDGNEDDEDDDEPRRAAL